MSKQQGHEDSLDLVSDIISDSGGTIVGRTRLQKIACLMELAGLGEKIEFNYHHYGPYSDELANATKAAKFLGYISETEQPTSWGGAYSIYTTEKSSNHLESEIRKKLAEIAVKANAVELELAVTAAFLANQEVLDPWEETKKRKSVKSKSGRLSKAKKLYEELRKIDTPIKLPNI